MGKGKRMWAEKGNKKNRKGTKVRKKVKREGKSRETVADNCRWISVKNLETEQVPRLEFI